MVDGQKLKTDHRRRLLAEVLAGVTPPSAIPTPTNRLPYQVLTPDERLKMLELIKSRYRDREIPFAPVFFEIMEETRTSGVEVIIRKNDDWPEGFDPYEYRARLYENVKAGLM